VPTTPFLLVSAYCYLKGSERMHGWLLSNRVVGRYLADYLEGRRMRRRPKAITLTFLWLTLLIAAAVIGPNTLYVLLLAAVGCVVSLYILLLPSGAGTV
jgi:uncharacterized membrane protein YbaN (DUF454 family)